MWKEGEGGWGVGGGCGVIAGFYGNVKGHPPYNIRDTVSEYKVYNLLCMSQLHSGHEVDHCVGHQSHSTNCIDFLL